jgi:sugar lactone lactonase YvrE
VQHHKLWLAITYVARLNGSSWAAAGDGLITCWHVCDIFELQGFYYANGVALAPDDSYVVMAETDMTRVHKIWVSGPKVRAQLKLIL